jgi:Glycosyltransferase family 87
MSKPGLKSEPEASGDYGMIGPKLRVAAITVLLAVMGGLVLLVVQPGLDPARIRPLPLIALAWIVFLCAAWLLRKVPWRTSVALILLGGIAVQLAAVSAPPRESDDLYRYIWDGRVQAAGIDPYEYVPTARQLVGLRDEFLWHSGADHCLSAAYVAAHPAADLVAGCTMINRPAVPTIYPPVAEAFFLGVHYLPEGDNSTTPIQAATAMVAVLTTVLLLVGLGRLGRDVRMAALWSWCPTVALEAGNSAHVDVVAAGIAAAALLLLATARGRTGRNFLGGALLGLAIATKLTPVLTVPGVLARGRDSGRDLRRRWVTVAVAAGGACVAVYIPHLLAVGGKVIGFLPGYLQQEGYDNGTRFGIIGLMVTGKLALAVAVLMLAAAALAVLEFADPERPWQGAVVMTAAALAVATPRYQWYALLLVMLVALDGQPEWLAFAAGSYYAAEPGMGRYTAPSRFVDAIGYGVPVLVVAAAWLVRRWLARRGAGLEPVPVLASSALPGTSPAPDTPSVPESSPVPGSSPVPDSSPAPAGTMTVTSAFAPPTTVTMGGGPFLPGFLTGWLPVSQIPNEEGR